MGVLDELQLSMLIVVSSCWHEVSSQDLDHATHVHPMLQAFEWTASQPADGSSLGYFPSNCWLPLIQDLQVTTFTAC